MPAFAAPILLPGMMPWSFYTDFIPSFPDGKKPSVPIEAHGYNDLIASVDYVKNRGFILSDKIPAIRKMPAFYASYPLRAALSCCNTAD